jgi:hypothetical protein
MRKRVDGLAKSRAIETFRGISRERHGTNQLPRVEADVTAACGTDKTQHAARPQGLNAGIEHISGYCIEYAIYAFGSERWRSATSCDDDFVGAK